MLMAHRVVCITRVKTLGKSTRATQPNRQAVYSITIDIFFLDPITEI